MVFTVFAAVSVWLVSGNPLYSLYLGLAAHLQILVGMTALGWQMGRRLQGKLGKDGAEINDSGEATRDGDSVTVEKVG